MIFTRTRFAVGLMSDERGAALIIAMMATLLLTALGVALAMATQTEMQIAASFRDGQEALYVADAGLELAVRDLAAAQGWEDLPAGSAGSTFIDPTMTPTLPGGGATIDLTRATAALQRDTDAANLWGANNPVWRLYASGPISNLLPAGAIDSSMYVAVWLADDPADGDGNPLADTNGVLTLHAEAFGHGGTLKVIEATIERRRAGVRMRAWHELR